MKFKSGEERFLLVKVIQIGNVIIELGRVAQRVHIPPEVEDKVELVRQTMVIEDSNTHLRIAYDDGQYWLKGKFQI